MTPPSRPPQPGHDGERGTHSKHTVTRRCFSGYIFLSSIIIGFSLPIIGFWSSIIIFFSPCIVQVPDLQALQPSLMELEQLERSMAVVVAVRRISVFIGRLSCCGGEVKRGSELTPVCHGREFLCVIPEKNQGGG